MKKRKNREVRRWNYYVCQGCGGIYVTLDVNRGTTPMMLNCRFGCGRKMMSQGYPHTDKWPVEARRTHDAEWYRPEGLEREVMRRKAPGLYDHVLAGGLILRPPTMEVPFPHPPGGVN